MRNLLKAMLTTGGATVVGQVLSLIVNKILAHYIGASGVGFYSLCRQVHESAASLGGVASGGLLQGLAARDGAPRRRLLRAAIVLSGMGMAIVAALLLIAPQVVADFLFGHGDEATLLAIRLCAATAILAVVYSILSGMVNAARAISALAVMAIVGVLAAALVAWPVALEARDNRFVLLVLIGLPLLVQIALAAVVLSRLGWRLGDVLGPQARPGAAEYRYFAGFFAFNVALTAVSTGAMLYIRARVVDSGGLAAAGLFAAGWGIGMQSMSLILSSFGTYVLPTVAAAGAEERRKVMQDAATLLIGLSLPLLTALLLFKPLVLRILFTAEFLPAVALLQWLLLGNYLKAISWAVAVPLPATADLRRYIFLEVGWYVVFVGSAVLAMQRMGWLPSIGLAFVATYLLYLLASVWLVERRFGFRLSARSVAAMVAGAAILVAAATLTWNDTTVDWPLAVSLPIFACMVSLLALTPQQRQRGRELLARLVGR